MTWYNDSNTTSGLLSALGRNGLLPASQELFGTDDLMRMMTEEAINRVVPFIVGLNEGYFLKTTWYSLVNSSSQLLSSAPASGTPTVPNPEYPFPPDSVGRRLHDVSVFWSNSRQVSLPQVTDYQVGKEHVWGRGVYIEGDHFTIFPAVQFRNATNLRLSYRAQPLPLCDDSGSRADGPTGAQAATVSFTASTATTSAFYTVSVGSLATVAAAWPTGYMVNIIDGDPGFSTRVTCSIYSTDSAGHISFLASDVQDAYGRPLLKTFDWIADVGFSPVLQLPRECALMVVYATLAKAYKALEKEVWQSHKATYDELKEEAKNLFAPRIDDAAKTLVPVRRGRNAGFIY